MSSEPEIAGHHVAGVDADADVERRPTGGAPFAVQLGQAGRHRERRRDGVIGVVLVVERRAEERHDHVADELVHRAAVREARWAPSARSTR